MQQALHAHTLYKLDVDYVVKDGEVIIVDEFTGRLMPGRRWSDGLHQAVEAKEGVKIEAENQTLATITFQNYFRMYEKLAGMTGTAETEAAEFDKIYKLEVVVIPTNRPMIRRRWPTWSTGREREKFDAIVEEIKELHENGQPVLVGTISIEKSRAARRRCSSAGRAAHRPQREVPRARSRDRRPGRPQRRGDDRDEHGRPRHRHPPRRQSRIHWPRRRRSDVDAIAAERKRIEAGDRRAMEDRTRGSGRARRPAHPRHRAPRVAAHRQSAPRPRRTPGRSRLVALLPFARRRSDAHLRRRPHHGLMERLGMEEGVPIEHGMVTRASSTRRSRSKAATSNPQAPARIRRRDEQAARVDLLAAPLDPRGREGKEYILNAADEIVDFLVETHMPEDAREQPNEQELNAELYDFFGLDLEDAGVDLAR